MRPFPLITLMLPGIITLPCRAQDTTWFNAFGKITTRAWMNTYRVKIHTDSGWRVNSYYKTGEISSTCLYADDSLRIPKEARSYYSPEGVLTCRRNYKEGKLNGIETYYYDNGKVWASGGNIGGKKEGEWKSWYPSGAPAAVGQFAGGKQVSARFFNEDGSPNDKVDSFFRRAAYPGGNAALHSYLQEHIRYPEPAKKYGAQGSVVVQFKITKEGRLKDMEVIKSVESSLDQEACRVLGGLDNWTPGLLGGLPIEDEFRLPVSFKLQD
jgi:TonB family protein